MNEIRATFHHLGGIRIARMRGAEGLIVHNSIASPSNGVRDILDRVLSSYQEIDGRFTAVGGLGRLLNLYEQLQRELERVSYEEIDRMNLLQVVEDGVPERVRLKPNEVVFVPKSWIGNVNEVVDLYVRGVFPVLPKANSPSLNNVGQ